MTARNILIASLGSHGDVHPFIGIGKGLLARGHQVTFISPPVYEGLAKSAGMDFAAIGTAERFEKLARDPNLWHRSRGFQAVARAVVESLPDYYQAVADHNRPGETMVLVSSLALGAKTAQEKFSIPGLTVHLSPSVLRSVIYPHKTPPLPVAAWQPKWFVRLIYAAIDKLGIDPALTAPLNKFRESVGLGPTGGIFAINPNSTERILGLFPEWFGPKAPDWPRYTYLSDFPLYDEADVTPMSEALLRFLEAGTPPIAFTPGSAMSHGRDFFTTAVETCKLLNRRGILLSRHLDHLPKDLPAQVHHEAYAPFSALLPHCAAVVYHGGIGSMSQAMAAGIPQLITPFGFDQFDNADRCKKLGVADYIPATRFTPKRAAKALSRLLNSPVTADACAKIKSCCDAGKALEMTMNLIEEHCQ